MCLRLSSPWLPKIKFDIYNLQLLDSLFLNISKSSASEECACDDERQALGVWFNKLPRDLSVCPIKCRIIKWCLIWIGRQLTAVYAIQVHWLSIAHALRYACITQLCLLFLSIGKIYFTLVFSEQCR